MALVKYGPMLKMPRHRNIGRCWQGSSYRCMLIRWS